MGRPEDRAPTPWQETSFCQSDKGFGTAVPKQSEGTGLPRMAGDKLLPNEHVPHPDKAFGGAFT